MDWIKFSTCIGINKKRNISWHSPYKGVYLKAGALVGKLPDPVQDEVHDLLADGVVPPRVVVRSILLSYKGQSHDIILN